MTATFWGPHFPLRHWGPHFPGYLVDAGNPPSGAATFVLMIEGGAQITYSWRTDVFKAYSGIERRAAELDDPLQSLKGSALLIGDGVRIARSQLALYAAAGRPFLIALPFEDRSLVADASGASVFPSSTDDVDWCNVGQRVVVVSINESDYVEAVIVSVAAGEIVLDTEPGTVGNIGGVAFHDVLGQVSHSKNSM